MTLTDRAILARRSEPVSELEARHRVEWHLTYTGSAELEPMARDCGLTLAETRRALKDLGAYPRKFNGWKAAHGPGSTPKLAPFTLYRLEPWLTPCSGLIPERKAA